MLTLLLQDCQDQESVNAALAQELRASKLKESELLSAANAREAISDAYDAEVVGLDAKVQELTASIHELEAGVNQRDEKLIQLKKLLQASWKRELELQAQRSRGESAPPSVNSTHVLEAGVIEQDETLMHLKNLLQASWKRELEFQEHQSESESPPPRVNMSIPRNPPPLMSPPSDEAAIPKPQERDSTPPPRMSLPSDGAAVENVALEAAVYQEDLAVLTQKFLQLQRDYAEKESLCKLYKRELELLQVLV
jgi:hypothetical protein